MEKLSPGLLNDTFYIAQIQVHTGENKWTGIAVYLQSGQVGETSGVWERSLPKGPRGGAPVVGCGSKAEL